MQQMERTEILEKELPAEDLELEFSETFLNFIRLTLECHRDEEASSNHSSKYEDLKTTRDQLDLMNKRIKPTRLPARTLCIGHKKFTRTNERNIFAKFCYRAKAIVCQMCNERLCMKVDIPFNKITSFVLFSDLNSDVLKLETKSSLKSFHASKPLPGMFHDWEVDDSKDNEDYFPESRTFFIEIEKGAIEESYAKLLYTNPEFPFSLAYQEMPYPTSSSDYHPQLASSIDLGDLTE